MSTRIEELKKTKYVGIVIHSNAGLYANGIIQNAFFIYMCLEKAGMKCRFLCGDENPTPFEFRSLPLQTISTNELEFDASEFHTIVTVTRGVSQEEYDMFKKHKINVVSFQCGNNFMHHLEDFVRGRANPHVTTYIGRGSPCDELWLIPSYEHSLEYVSLIRGKPTYIIPHLWSNIIIAETAANRFKMPESDLIYNYANHPGKKINILILEPNMAIFKTCWVPLLAGEKLFIENEGLLDNVYAFNFPTFDSSYSMTDNLLSDKKIRKFKRLAIPEILAHFNKEDSFPVIVSHQILNSLNYLYYEALYYGWPLVHNSPDLDGCGYYYPENNIGACAEAIKKAYRFHNRTAKEYLDKGRAYLKRVDPLDPDMIRTWDGMISEGVSRSLAAPAAL